MSQKRRKVKPPSRSLSTRAAEPVDWPELVLGRGLPLLVAALLVALSPSTHDTFGMPKFLVLLAGTAALTSLLVFASVRAGRLEIPRSPLLALVLAFLAIVALSTVFSTNPTMSVLGKYERYEGLLSFVSYGLLFFLGAQILGRRANGIWVFFRVILPTVTLVAVYGLIQHTGRDLFSWSAEGFEATRSFATLGNPVLLGSLLALTLPLFLAGFALQKKAWARVAYGASLAAAGAAALATLSRGAWLGAAVGAVVLALLVRGIVTPEEKRRIAAIVLLAAAAMAIVAIVPSAGAPSVMGRLSSLGNLAQELDPRIEIWKGAVSITAGAPLLGSGPDTFQSVLPAHETLGYMRGPGREGLADSAHNYFLQLASTSGIFALLAFLALIAVFFGLVRRFVHSDENRRERLFYAGLVAGIAGYLTSLFFGVHSQATGAVFWVSLGAIAARTAREEPIVPRFSAWPGPARHALAVVAVVIAAGVIAFSIRLYSADNALKLAVYYGEIGGPGQAIANYERASELNPYFSYYHNSFGEALLDWAGGSPEPWLIETAIAHFKKAKEVDPREIDNYLFLGQAYLMSSTDRGHLDSAERELKQAMKLERYPALAHYLMSRVRSAQGRKADAGTELRQAIRIDPRLAETSNP